MPCPLLLGGLGTARSCLARCCSVALAQHAHAALAAARWPWHSTLMTCPLLLGGLGTARCVVPWLLLGGLGTARSCLARCCSVALAEHAHAALAAARWPWHSTLMPCPLLFGGLGTARSCLARCCSVPLARKEVSKAACCAECCPHVQPLSTKGG